ncbi:hypothetical protein OAR27_02620, partial [Alphaproteobacteria bacterium]|nr:hypothetical protein [Alphaproteobacteria bacterium]
MLIPFDKRQKKHGFAFVFLPSALYVVGHIQLFIKWSFFHDHFPSLCAGCRRCRWNFWRLIAIPAYF